MWRIAAFILDLMARIIRFILVLMSYGLTGRWRPWFRRQRTLLGAGFAVIVVGILCLCLSGMVAPTGSWWQGTLDAFGVGFVVGGLIDVLAISGLNQILTREQRRRDELSRQFDVIMRITDPLDRANAAAELLRRRGTEFDPDLSMQLRMIVLSDFVRREEQRQAQDKHAESSGHDDVSRASGDH